MAPVRRLLGRLGCDGVFESEWAGPQVDAWDDHSEGPPVVFEGVVVAA